jgi:hypothetical protein
MHYRIALIALVFAPAALTAQGTTASDLFTWSGRMASGATLGIRHYNGPIDVRESTTDRVEFRASRPTRRDGDMTFVVENTAEGVTICGVYRGRSACDSGRRGWDWDEGPGSSRLTVSLPKGVRLAASTGNGDVTVEKAGNDVHIRSGNGDVRIGRTGDCAHGEWRDRCPHADHHGLRRHELRHREWCGDRVAPQQFQR